MNQTRRVSINCVKAGSVQVLKDTLLDISKYMADDQGFRAFLKAVCMASFGESAQLSVAHL